MIDSEKPKYLEWLNTIANARLIFNTLDELEDYLDNHNIRTNGVKRCYNTEQKARAAFADVYPLRQLRRLICPTLAIRKEYLVKYTRTHVRVYFYFLIFSRALCKNLRLTLANVKIFS